MKYFYEKDLIALLIHDVSLARTILSIRKNSRNSDNVGILVYRAILDSAKQQKVIAFKICPANDVQKKEMAEEVFSHFDMIALRIAK